MLNAEMDAEYGRVSTGRQEREKTIDAQLHAIRTKFGPEGRAVYETYLDQNVSGTILDRPGLNACLAAARAGKFTRVLIDHPDRLARGDSWKRPFIERQFADCGVVVVYASYERRSGAEGEMLDDMINAFAAYERKQIRRRMADGHASKLARGGIYRAQRPFGWCYEPPTGEGRDGRMVPVPEEQRVVRLIFDWVLAGKTSYWIADELNRAGYHTRNGGRWYDKAVQHVVKNPIHTGWVPTKPSQPEAEWHWVKVGPPIVTREEWQRARAQLSANKSLSKRNAKHEYPLRKLLHCGHTLEGQPDKLCGRVLTGRADASGTRRYRCTRSSRGSDPAVKHACGHYVLADWIEEQVWDAVLDTFAHPEQVIAEWQRQRAGTDAQSERLAAQLAAVHDRHKAAQAKLDALLDLRLTGEVDPPTYARKQVELTALRESCRGEIAYLERQLIETEQRQTWQQEFTDLLRATAKLCGIEVHGVITTTDEEKQAFIRQVVREVWVMPGGCYSVEFGLSAEAVPEGVTVRQSPLQSPHSYHAASQRREFRWSVVIAA